MIQNAAQKISWASNTLQTDLTQKIDQADKDLKVAAPILDALGHREAAEAARAIQINVMPVLKKTNSLKKIGQQKIQESVQKVQEDIEKQSEEVKAFVEKKIDDNKEIITQSEKVITQTIVAAGMQNLISNNSSKNDKQRVKTEEQEKDKSFNPINTQISKDSPVRGILKKNNQMQSITSDFQQTSQKNEQKSQKFYNLKDLDQLTQKAKGYYNKLIGKKVNTRLEYFNLLIQQLKLQPDDNLLTQSKTKLKDKVWELSFQERRFISFNQLRTYLLEVIEFLNYHFLVLECVFKNLKLRFKSSTNSFHQLNLFFNQVIQQLSGFDNEVGSKNNLFKEPPQLNQLYTRQLAYQNSQKQNTENQIYLPQLNQIFTNLHNTNQQQLSNLNNLKLMIKNEFQPALTTILNKDQQRVRDYILQVQGQRNISLEWFELTYQEYQKFSQIFKQNTQLIFENKPIQQDLFNQEYKLLYNLRKFIEQHKIFGSLTAHLTEEMRKIDVSRTQQSLVQMKLFFQEYQKHFTQYSQFSSLFDNLNHIKECEESYQITQIIPEELQEVIKRVVNTQSITQEQYLAFAAKFNVQKPPSYIEQNPLILKQFIISRDVAWERSLSLGVDYIKSICYITVDGFMLFFDQDWQQQGNNEPSSASNQLYLKDCSLSKSKSDPTAINIIINLKGRLFNREKKYKIRFQDDQDIDALNFSITQFQQ